MTKSQESNIERDKLTEEGSKMKAKRVNKLIATYKKWASIETNVISIRKKVTILRRYTK